MKPLVLWCLSLTVFYHVYYVPRSHSFRLTDLVTFLAHFHIGEYVTNDLRISIVYRARCFEDAAEAKRFREQSDLANDIAAEANGKLERGSGLFEMLGLGGSGDNARDSAGEGKRLLSLEQVLETLANELVRRGKGDC